MIHFPPRAECRCREWYVILRGRRKAASYLRNYSRWRNFPLHEPSLRQGIRRRGGSRASRPPSAEPSQSGEIWRIVGEDEAEPAKGTLSYVSPVARALMNKQVGDVIVAGSGEAEIVATS